MSKLPYLACIAGLLLLGAKPQNEMFAKYKAVEAYEIRPGVLAMPRYAEDGQVCEIGIERRVYSPGMIRINQPLSQKEVDEIADELVPPKERGPRSNGLPSDGAIMEGLSYTRQAVYENVIISSFGAVTDVKNGVGFTIQWTKRKCQ